MENFRFLPFEIKLSDNQQALTGDDNSIKIGEEVQVLRTGAFRLGEDDEDVLNITTEMLDKIILNFENKVRGIDIAVDYKHDSDDIAAGWFTDLHLLNEGTELWAKVKWTPKGLKKLGEREFRYLSSEVHRNYKNNETGERFGITLMGAGLTNRPVIKGMDPIVALAQLNQKPKGENKMGEITKESLLVENTQLKSETKKLSEELKEFQELEMSPEEMMAKIKELQAELEKLRGEKSQMEEEKKLAEKGKAFDKLLSENKAVEAQRDPYIKNDMVKFAELSGSMNVKPAGSDKGSSGDGGSEDVEDKVLELAEKKAKESNITLFDAVSEVLSENEDLRKKHEAKTA